MHADGFPCFDRLNLEQSCSTDKFCRSCGTDLNEDCCAVGIPCIQEGQICGRGGRCTSGPCGGMDEQLCAGELTPFSLPLTL